MNDYPYPVWGTQGGGLVRRVGKTYIFVEKPDCPGLDVGDELPEEWGIASANRKALAEDAPNPFAEDSLEGGLFTALGELHRCRSCGKMLNISMPYRHEEYGCYIAEQIG